MKAMLGLSGGLLAVALATARAGEPPAGGAALRFRDLGDASGVTLRMTCGATPSRHILEANGGGVALLDYDNDGDLDLFLANGATLAAPEEGPGSRLYANRGDGTFVDVTAASGIQLKRWAMGVAVGDVNGDGCQDLYVTCYGPNVLLQNNCHEHPPRFVDVSARAGVADPGWGTSAAFADLDGDQDLDLYVANYLEFDARTPPAGRRNFKGVEVMPGPAGLTAQADVLYENLGDGRFRDISAASGCTAVAPGYGLGVMLLDLAADGTPEIFVGNDSTDNFLFQRQADGKFRDLGIISGLATNYNGNAQATMGIAVGDVDDNGLADLFTTNFSNDSNTLQVNLGGALFEDRTSQYGLAMVSYPYLSWGAGLYDFDCDGDEDLFIASGHVYPEAATHKLDTDYEQPVLLFERSGGRFLRTLQAGAFCQRRYAGRSLACGDLDGDGDVDVVMTTLNGPVHIFRNEAPRPQRLVVALVGPQGNLRALGSRISLVGGGRPQTRWIDGGSYQSVDAPLAYFGLGSRAAPQLIVRVTWPNGAATEHQGIQPNHRLQIAFDGTVTSTPLP